MIYANHEKIAPDQEKALLDFVAGGKGFLPIHSASFCFQNSPAYIALVGATVPAPRHRRVHDDDREHLASGDGRDAAVPGLGRDLRPHQAQSGRPHRPDGTRRRGRPRAVDVGADARQGPRLLHGVRPRRARLEQPELSQADQERDPLGRRASRWRPARRAEAPAAPLHRRHRSRSRTTNAAVRRRDFRSRSRPPRRPSTSRFRQGSSCSCSRPSR